MSSPMVAGATRRALDDQAARRVAEGDRGDFLDPRHRDQDQRHQQDQAQRQREGRAEHEIMAGPKGEHGRDPGADAVGRRRQHQRLQHASDRASRRIGSDIRMPTRRAMVASFQ